MQPADRITLIERCARALQGRDWGDIDFILDQFGLPTTDRWDGGGTSPESQRFAYVREMLGHASGSGDDRLEQIDRYLQGLGRTDRPEDHPWAEGEFRLFLTHLASHKGYTTELKSRLKLWGVDAFVAHEDVEPGAEWLRTIVAALHSCDALVALMHDGFRGSNWCDQEVGVAMGREVPCVPVRIDLDPYGFLGTVQAVAATTLTTPQVARAVVETLIRDKRTSRAITAAVVRALVGAYTFGQANGLAMVLRRHAHALTWDDVDRIRAAQKTNVDVGRAFDVEPALVAIEAKLPPRPAPARPAQQWEYEEEPF